MKRKISINRASQAGVSLIELMVGLTIGLIITAGALTILFSNQKLILEKDVMDRSQENFRFASTTITRMVRQATSFGFPENNNELIVYFDRSQRDCLGQQNHSSMNTFKVSAQNELVCILTLDDGTTQTVTLAKDIPEVKFAYGIQNGVSANSLVYQSFFSGESGTKNTSVSNVWGTVTSVLSQMSVSEGSNKQSTIDFISTSHLLALTKLASSGDTSHANPPSSSNTTGNGSTTGNGNTTGNGSTTGNGNTTGNSDTTSNTDCSASDLAFIKVKYGENGNVSWPDQGTYTISNLGNKGHVVVTADLAKISKTWKLAMDGGDPQTLISEKTYTLPAGGNSTMSLVLICGSSIKGTIFVKAGK